MDATLGAEPVWHDAECGGYSADLPLFGRLADGAGRTVLDLGCGTGRVALHLAGRGHEVTGIDADAALVDVLRERARDRELPVSGITADARTFDLRPSTYSLILAPMQLAQLLGGPVERTAMLERIVAHLEPGARAALAIVENPAEGFSDRGTLPDVREHDGFVYSSLPTRTTIEAEHLVIERLRQLVAPDGAMTEQVHTERLDLVGAPVIEAEAQAAGLLPAGRERLADSSAHVGSTIVLLEAPHA